MSYLGLHSMKATFGFSAIADNYPSAFPSCGTEPQSSSACAVLRLACPVGQSLSLRQLALTLVVGYSISYLSSFMFLQESFPSALQL